MRLELAALAHIGVLPTGLEHDLHFFTSQEKLKRKEKDAALNWMTGTRFLLTKMFSARTTDLFELPHPKTEERGISLTVQVHQATPIKAGRSAAWHFIYYRQRRST